MIPSILFRKRKDFSSRKTLVLGVFKIHDQITTFSFYSSTNLPWAASLFAQPLLSAPLTIYGPDSPLYLTCPLKARLWMTWIFFYLLPIILDFSICKTPTSRWMEILEWDKLRALCCFSSTASGVGGKLRVLIFFSSRCYLFYFYILYVFRFIKFKIITFIICGFYSVDTVKKNNSRLVFPILLTARRVRAILIM